MTFTETKKLQLSNEVLRARLDIRDFFLKTAVREVYENIGQVLSLVRMQLSLMSLDSIKAPVENTESPGQLVGQSIKDLRLMCRSFYPDNDLLLHEGFLEGIETSLKILFPNENPYLKIKGRKEDLQSDVKLVVFKIILDILTVITKSDSTLSGIDIYYEKTEIRLLICFTGQEVIDFVKSDAKKLTDELTLEDRLQLIEGRIQLTEVENGVRQLKILAPYKIPFYE